MKKIKLLVLASVISIANTWAQDDPVTYYNTKVRPIFVATCNCHFEGGEGVEFFDSTKYALGMEGTESSRYYENSNFKPVLFFAPGKLDSSMLYLKVAYTPNSDDLIFPEKGNVNKKIDMGSRMPLEGGYLSKNSVAIIGKWILMAGGLDTSTYVTSIHNRTVQYLHQKKRLQGVSSYQLPSYLKESNLYDIKGNLLYKIRGKEAVKLNKNKIYFIEEGR